MIICFLENYILIWYLRPRLGHSDLSKVDNVQSTAVQRIFVYLGSIKTRDTLLLYDVHSPHYKNRGLFDSPKEVDKLLSPNVNFFLATKLYQIVQSIGGN